MTEPFNAIASAAASSKTIDAMGAEAAKTTARLWEKVLGPPAEAIGQHLRSRIDMWSEDALARRVLERAAKKIDADEAGTVPPRVAADIFEKAQWAEDDFLAEYLSGVLASSRTSGGKDDRGVAWTALVGRLSSDQLRLHYIIYRAYRRYGVNVEYEALSEVLGRTMVFTMDALGTGMGLPKSDEGVIRLLDALYGLVSEDLLSQYLSHGSAEFIAKNNTQYEVPTDAGDLLLISGTTRGAALYLHAHGLGQQWAGYFLESEATIDLEWPEGQVIPEVDAFWLEDLRKS